MSRTDDGGLHSKRVSARYWQDVGYTLISVRAECYLPRVPKSSDDKS